MIQIYIRKQLAAVLSLAFCFQAVAQDEQPGNYEPINVDGLTRLYRIFIPESYSADTAVPLLFDFHGSGSNPARQEATAQFEPLAEEKGFIVVTPVGAPVPSNGGRNSWNVDFFPGDPDDVSFVRAMIYEISAQYTIDANRIFATGHSGGGRMSSRVACSLSDVVAAIGPNAGIRWPDVCEPERPVPIITFHGKQDAVNHYEVQPDSPPYWLLGVEDSLAGWVENNQCDPAPIETPISESRTRVAYQNCADGGDIVFYRSETDGHIWSDVATNLIWEFFEAHPMNSDM